MFGPLGRSALFRASVAAGLRPANAASSWTREGSIGCPGDEAMGDRINTDQVLHNAMTSLGLEDPSHRVQIEGPLYQNVDAEQRKELEIEHAAPKFALSSVVDYTSEHLAERALELHCKLLNGLVTFAAEKTLDAFLDTVHQG